MTACMEASIASILIMLKSLLTYSKKMENTFTSKSSNVKTKHAVSGVQHAIQWIALGKMFSSQNWNQATGFTSKTWEHIPCVPLLSSTGSEKARLFSRILRVKSWNEWFWGEEVFCNAVCENVTHVEWRESPIWSTFYFCFLSYLWNCMVPQNRHLYCGERLFFSRLTRSKWCVSWMPKPEWLNWEHECKLKRKSH